MNRRELVAGIGSASALAGGGVLLRFGPPRFGSDGPATSGDDAPLEIETIDAPGSEAGSVRVPAGTVTLVTFFVTGCGNCQAQLPELAAARERLDDRAGDAVRFLAVTYQRSETLPPADLRDWWAAYDGDWPVGYDSGLSGAYGVVGYPTTIVLDSDGEKRFHETDVLDRDTVVRVVENGLEAGSSADAPDETSEE